MSSPVAAAEAHVVLAVLKSIEEAKLRNKSDNVIQVRSSTRHILCNDYVAFPAVVADAAFDVKVPRHQHQQIGIWSSLENASYLSDPSLPMPTKWFLQGDVKVWLQKHMKVRHG